jgi:ubiquinone/menaquinone biosynthesis C-methylase UbiE
MQDGATRKGHRWFAAAYDVMARGMERGLIGRMRAELLRDVSGDVLEIGAGTGANFAHYPAVARVVAIEPDPHMLKRARARARATQNVDVRDAPAERLPFDDASFDFVISTLVLCTVDDVPVSLAEIRRVLRRGGELRFLEHVRAGGALGRMQDAIQPVYGWMSGGCHGNRDTERLLRDAGFDFAPIDHRKLAPWQPAIIGIAKARS